MAQNVSHDRVRLYADAFQKIQDATGGAFLARAELAAGGLLCKRTARPTAALMAGGTVRRECTPAHAPSAITPHHQPLK